MARGYQRVEDTMLRDPRGDLTLVAFLIGMRCGFATAQECLLSAADVIGRGQNRSPFRCWVWVRCMEAHGRLQGDSGLPLVFAEKWDWRQVEE